jgi:hypothetical protein
MSVCPGNTCVTGIDAFFAWFTKDRLNLTLRHATMKSLEVCRGNRRAIYTPLGNKQEDNCRHQYKNKRKQYCIECCFHLFAPNTTALTRSFVLRYACPAHSGEHRSQNDCVPHRQIEGGGENKKPNGATNDKLNAICNTTYDPVTKCYQLRPWHFTYLPRSEAQMIQRLSRQPRLAKHSGGKR